MIEVAAGNLDVPNLQPSLDELAIANCGTELLKGYGKVALSTCVDQGRERASSRASLCSRGGLSPYAHRRSADGSLGRSCCQMTLDVESVVDGRVCGQK